VAPPELQRRTGEIRVEPAPDGDGRATGAVRWFSQEKGYGFLAPDDGGEDVFVRFSAISGEGFRTLTAGQRVTYVLGDDGRGPRANDVRPA
jgi:CspA family cold shock protein